MTRRSLPAAAAAPLVTPLIPPTAARPAAITFHNTYEVLHSDWAYKIVWLDDGEGGMLKTTWEFAEDVLGIVPADPLGMEWTRRQAEIG